ncbi:hypothetical protein VNI00_004154 [Paramarasmius palmivorus]|uniref:MYND-type domain-containing protein n=1 Tax=Paramarasmius palmivorus TaxID=297713 RepID=A0AAW0DPG5_9AGAR
MDDLPIIFVKGFVFCTHGREFCSECTMDQRKQNSSTIEKELLAAFPGRPKKELLEDRPSLENVRSLAVVSDCVDNMGLPLYKCKIHSGINCDSCFDWVPMVIKRIKAVESLGDRIEIDATRQEKLGLLASMGVKLLPTTRIPEEAVDKRLRSAIDAAQYFPKFSEHVPFNPKSFPVWPDSEPLKKAVSRNNLAEAMKVQVGSMTGEDPFPLYQNAFIDVRQTLMGLGSFVDKGLQTAYIEDREEEHAICLRIVEVRKIAEGELMIVVLVLKGTRDSPNVRSVYDWVREVQSKPGGFPRIYCTAQEQQLLLSILNQNSKRLSSDYQPKRWKSESKFMLSFLLPVGPISQDDIGKLSNHSGCVLCGNKTTSKCSQCLSVEYCGRECQKVHWKEHKQQCKSLKGGNWSTVAVSLTPASVAGSPYLVHINNNSPLERTDSSALEQTRADLLAKKPPTNIHGDQAFLVKIQRPLVGSTGAMLVYDRQRSFHFYLHSTANTIAYMGAMKEMGHDPKIYRWAKRSGDFELSICLDRAPANIPAW